MDASEFKSGCLCGHNLQYRIIGSNRNINLENVTLISPIVNINLKNKIKVKN